MLPSALATRSNSDAPYPTENPSKISMDETMRKPNAAPMLLARSPKPPHLSILEAIAQT